MTLLPPCNVCLVSWRSRDVIGTALRALADDPQVGRIIVVDNDSRDGTVEFVREQFPSVHLIANDHNAGFAAGNNQAIRESTAPFVLLLNPDTEVQPGAVAAMLAVFAEDAKIVAVAPQLRYPDGTIQRSVRGFPEPAAILLEGFGLARLFPHSAALNRYRLRDWDHDSRRDVDQPMASALMVRRSALDEVGLFDEAFPLYFNDVDLCYRLRQAGGRIVFEPAAKVIHHHGHSTRQVRPQAVLESHRSLMRFYRKHYRGRVGWFGYAAVMVLAWVTDVAAGRGGVGEGEAGYCVNCAAEARRRRDSQRAFQRGDRHA